MATARSSTPLRPSESGSSLPLPAQISGDPRVRMVTPGVAGHQGEFVLYWAQMFRRAQSNGALSYAIAEANDRGLPVLVYEALRVDYPYASDRFHTFVLEGARGEANAYRQRGAAYAFFLPRSRDEARGVLRQLTKRAALLVTDDYPTFLVPDQIGRLAERCPCPLIAFDDNAVMPLALFPKEEYAARTIRPKVHRALPDWLRPVAEPLCQVAPPEPFDLPFEPYDVEHAPLAETIATLPIDHTVTAVASSPGGSAEARRRLTRFLRKLSAYPEDHNDPDAAGTSALSPYLHFGHISAREVALAVRDADAPSEARDAFLEQVLVRRTLAYSLAWTNRDHRTLAAAPAWALKALDGRLGDARPQLYSREELENAKTDDPVWNAAQRELVTTGVIQNYLRMQWGKNVIAWKPTAAEAFDDLVYLNDKYGLDGRNPNTYTNILWCFGKHDRPWGPVRPIYGTVRYMSSINARRKLRMEDYLATWS